MTRLRSEVEDLVPLLEKILERPTVAMAETSTCGKCGCLMLPADSSCPSCRDKAMRELGF